MNISIILKSDLKPFVLSFLNKNTIYICIYLQTRPHHSFIKDESSTKIYALAIFSLANNRTICKASRNFAKLGGNAEEYYSITKERFLHALEEDGIREKFSWYIAQTRTWNVSGMASVLPPRNPPLLKIFPEMLHIIYTRSDSVAILITRDSAHTMRIDLY